MNIYFPGSTDQQDEVLRALGHKPPEKTKPPEPTPPPPPELTHEEKVEELLGQILAELQSINRQIPIDWGSR